MDPEQVQRVRRVGFHRGKRGGNLGRDEPGIGELREGRQRDAGLAEALDRAVVGAAVRKSGLKKSGQRDLLPRPWGASTDA